MEPIIVLVLIGFVFFILLPAIINRLLGSATDEDDDEEEKERPRLRGEDLQAWTRLYQTHVRLAQSTYYYTMTDVENFTWERYAELTGKPQWVEPKKSTTSK